MPGDRRHLLGRRSPRRRSTPARRRSTTSPAAPIRRCSSWSPSAAAATCSCTSRDRRGSTASRPVTRDASRAPEALVRGADRGRRSPRRSAEEQIALDPGLDFDLSVDDDLEILRRLGELRELGRPLFVALSRKDFLGAVLAGSWEGRAPELRGSRRRSPRPRWPSPRGPRSSASTTPNALDALRVAAAIADPRAGPAAVARSLDLSGRTVARAGSARSSPGGPTIAWSARARRRAARAELVRSPPVAGTRGSRPRCRGRDRTALLASGRGARGGRRRQRDRHQRHRLGQVALVQPAGARRDRRTTRRRGRSTSTRPRRSPRTRRESSPLLGPPRAAPRDLRRRHAARRPAAGSAPRRT